MARFERPQIGRAMRGRPSEPEFGGGFDTIASMRAPGSQNPYEVYCHRCNVTAPVGTRRCIHCGGPISPGGQDPRRAALAALVGVDPGGVELGAAEEIGEETPPSAASLVPKIALWILLLFGGFLYRFCN